MKRYKVVFSYCEGREGKIRVEARNMDSATKKANKCLKKELFVDDWVIHSIEELPPVLIPKH